MPTARPLWDGCAGLDDSSTCVDAGLIADCEGFVDVQEVTELGDVAVYEDEEATVDGFRSAIWPAPELGDATVYDDEEDSIEMLELAI